MAIQVRRGNEADFDPSKMLPGEWAVSLDTKYIRMCISPGMCLRMATYESFEADTQKFINQMNQILADTKTVQEAVERIQDEIEGAVVEVETYANRAKSYSDSASSFSDQSKKYAEESKGYADDAYDEAERAKMYAENASAVTGVNIATKDVAGIIKGGDNHIAEDGTLMLTKRTTDPTLDNSHAGGVKINEIGGVSEQETTTGKNLLDYELFTKKLDPNASGTFSESDGKLTIQTIANGNSGMYAYGVLPEDDVTATLSMDVTISAGSKIKFGFGATNTILSIEPNKKTRISMTGQISTSESIIIYSGESVAKTITIENIQLELGSTATDYEPYTGGKASPNPDYPQEIKSVEVSEIVAHGKNLFAYGVTVKDVTSDYRVTASQRLTLSAVEGDVNKLKCNYNGNYSIGYFEISGIDGTKNYSISFDVETNTTSYTPRVGLSDYSTNEKLVVFIDGNNSANWTGSGYYFILSNIQIEESEVATDYEPYQESAITLSNPIVLRGPGGVRDRFICKDGVWGIERNFSVWRLDGTYPWALAGVGTVYERFGAQTGIKPRGYYTNMCTHFKSTNTVTSGDNVICIYSTGWIDVKATKFTSAEEFKQFLIDEEVELYYELATPTFEPLPEADQVALHNLKSFDTITYVECDSEVQPTWDLEYGTSKVGAKVLELQNENAVPETTPSQGGSGAEILSFAYSDDVNSQINSGDLYFALIDGEDKVLCNITGSVTPTNADAIIYFKSDILNNTNYTLAYNNVNSVEYSTSGYKPIVGIAFLKTDGFEIELRNTSSEQAVVVNSSIILKKK